MQIVEARFVATAVAPEQYPRGLLPEIAFVGRSNVGKSSMINALVHRRKLVRVSNTPGRTRTLNFFEVRLSHEGRERLLRLCDLPGYGFAKASKADRSAWQEMISAYLTRRKDLKVVVSIIDAEVGPQRNDFETLDYLSSLAPKILVVATKLDRISKAQRIPAIKRISEQLELPADAVVGFSATEGLGVEAVWDRLLTTAYMG